MTQHPKRTNNVLRVAGKSTRLLRRVATATSALTLFSILVVVPSHALPQNGAIVAGSATIAQSGSTSMTINQTSQNAIINWQGFSIGAAESVKFIQPSSSAIALNRVTGVDPSSIYGFLSGNGQVWVINPNGLLVGPGATVQTGSFLASTMNISNDAFMSGRYQLTNPYDSLATIVNHGTILAADGGYVVLAAPSVTNFGSIIANVGTVQLASGDAITLSINNGNLINVAVHGDVASGALGVSNSGLIRADGGQVLLTARVAGDVMKNVVNNEGIIEARTIVEKDGIIFLDGGDHGITANSGTLDAMGTNPGEHGGTVALLGDKVGLFAGSTIDASGDTGGGRVLVGGNYQGKGPEKNAAMTYVDKDAVIKADALGSGDGGTVVVWADDATRFYGTISAQGGVQGGDGGSVEVSGKRYLEYAGLANLGAPKGRVGTLLLDPDEITIIHSPGADTAITVTGAGPFVDSSSGAGSILTDGTLNTQLGAASVTVTTATDSITSNSDVVIDIKSKTLTLNSAKDITLGGTFSDTGALGTLALKVGQVGTGGGALMISSGALISAHTVSAAGGSGNDTFTLGAGVQAFSGSVTGGGGTDTLAVSNGINAWQVTGAKAGTLNATTTFSGITNLTGGSGADTFTLATGVPTLNGTITGGGGTDTLTATNGANAWQVTAVNAGTLNTTTVFSAFTNLIGGSGTDTFSLAAGVSTFNGTIVGGGGTDTLAATDGANAWQIAAVNAGTLNTSTIFSAITNLTGGTGTDTLTGIAGGGSWNISGAKAVTVSGLNGTLMDALVGGSGSDTFTLAAGVSAFVGTIAGGGGSDTLAATDGTNAWQVTGANTGTLNTTTLFSGLTNLIGGSGTDTLTGFAGGSSWNLSGVNAVTVSGMNGTSIDVLIGGSGADTFTLAAGVSTFNGIVAGGGGSDTFAATDGTNVWQVTGVNAGTLNTSTTFSGITNLTGGTGTDTLTGSASGSSWNVNGAKTVTVSGMNGTSMDALVGGSGNDTFTLTTGVSTFNGAIAGGGGIDTLTATDGTNAWQVTAVSAGTLNNTTTFSAFTNLIGGSGTDTITGVAGGSSWNISGVKAVTVSGMNGTSMDALVGGIGADTFTLATLVPSLNGTITGGGGVDTLVATDGTNAWQVTAASAGTLNTTTIYSGLTNLAGGSGSDTFTGIAGGSSWNISGIKAATVSGMNGTSMDALVGGSGADTFTLAAGVPTFNGTIAGGGGIDTLTAVNGTNAWQVTAVNAGTLNSSTIFSGLTNLTGSSGTDTLTGLAGGSIWNISGAKAVTVSGMNGTSMDTLVGGSGADTFALATLVPSFNGTITGGGGIDTLSATNGVNAWQVTAANTGSLNTTTLFSGLTNIAGGSGADTLTGVAGGSSWNISGAKAVSVSGMNGTSMDALVGGTGADTFTLATLVPSFTGTITGGGGIDTLTATDGTNAWQVTAANAGTLNTTTIFSGLTNLNGGSGTDTLTGVAGGNSWNISGPNAATVSGLSGTSMDVLIGGAGADTFALAVGIVTFNGTISGGGGSDTLTATDGSNAWQITAANSGTLNATTTFSGLTNLTGGSGTDTLTGVASGSSWNISGVKAVTVSSLSGTSMDALVGGTGTDIFVLAAGVSTFNGTIAGGGGIDTIVATDGANAWQVTGANAGTLNTTTIFSGLTNLNGGSGTDTLTGVTGGSSWNISGVKAVTVSGMNGTLMDALVGGTGVDTFTLAAGVSTFNGTVAGGGGSDTLASTDGTNSWQITAANAGILNTTTTFSGLTNLTGGSGIDTLTGTGQTYNFDPAIANKGNNGTLTWTSVENLTDTGAGIFKFGAAGSISGSISASGGTLDYTGHAAAVNVTLAGNASSATTGIGSTWNGISTVIGSANTTDTISGTAQTYTMDNAIANKGSNGIVTWTSIENLFDNGAGIFKFGAAGNISGSLSASGGTLDYTGHTVAVNVNLAGNSGTTTGIGGNWSGISTVIGSANTTDTVTGTTQTYTLDNSVANKGSNGTVTWTGLENLVDTGAGMFKFGSSGSVTGLINSLGGTLDYTGYTSAVSVNLAGNGGATTGIGGSWSGITSIIGSSNSTDTITGSAQTYNLDPAVQNKGSNGTTNWTSMENLTDSGAGIFKFNASGSISGSLTASGGTLDYGGHSTAVSVNLAGSTGATTGIGGTWNGITTVIGNANTSDTITGTAQTYTLDPVTANKGSNGTVNWASMENLSDSGAGIINFGAAGSVSGNISTVNGTLNYSGHTSPVNVNLTRSSGSTTGIDGSWSGVTTLNGSSASDTISSAGATYTLSSASSGSSGGVSWSSFEKIADSGTGSLATSGGQTYTLTGANSGFVATLLLDGFTGIGNLADTGAGVFRFGSNGSISGSLSAQNGTLDYSAGISGPVGVNLNAKSGTAIGGTWSGITTITGSASSDTITANSEKYVLTSVNAGNSSGVSWTSFEKITDAGVGTIATTGGQTYTLTGANSGYVTTLLPGGFTGIGSLEDSSAGIFKFGTSGSVTGTITAVNGTLDYSAGIVGPVGINLSTKNGTGISGGWNGITTVIGSTASDTITATGATYNLTSSDAGNSTGVSWTSIENLRDTSSGIFRFNSGGFLTGGIYASGGTLDYSAGITGAVGVNLATKTGSGIGGSWYGITTIIGSITADTITSTGATYNLTAPDAGNSGGVAWTSFENIADSGVGVGTLATTGGQTYILSGTNAGSVADLLSGGFMGIGTLKDTGAGTFKFGAAGSITGSITAVNGTLDYSAGITGPIAVNLTSRSGSGIGGSWNGITTVIGSAAIDTIISSGATYTLTGTDEGNSGVFSWSSIENLHDTAAGKFKFAAGGSVSGGLTATGGTLDYSAGIVGPVDVDLTLKSGTGIGTSWNGITTVIGSAASDTIMATGATYTITSPDAGNSSGVFWTSFEKIADFGVGTITTNGGQTYNLTGANSGTITTLLPGGFTGIGNLSDSGSGSFRFDAIGTVSGSIAAINGTLDYSAGIAGPVEVNLSTRTGNAIGGFWSGITTVTGSSSAADTISGSSQKYTLTATDAGNNGSVSWISFENLIGVSGTNTYIGAGGSLSGAIVDNGTNTTLQGALTTRGAQAYNGAVKLGAATILTSIGSGTITFAGTVASDATPRDLTVDTAGGITFGGAVGTTALNTLTITGGGTTTINGGTVTTSGTGGQTYNNAVLLGSDTTLQAGSGAITVASTVDGALTLGLTAGNVTLAGAVGGATRLTALSITAGSDIALNNTAASSGPITLTAGNAITEGSAGSLRTTALLTTLSRSGQSLVGNGTNAIASFNGSNSASGDITLANSAAPLTITGINQAGGHLNLTNSGAITSSGPLVVVGNTTITAIGQPITLTDANNDFTGTVTVSGAATRIVDKNNLDVVLNTTGLTTVNAGAGLGLSGVSTDVVSATAVDTVTVSNPTASLLIITGDTIVGTMNNATPLDLTATNQTGVSVNLTGNLPFLTIVGDVKTKVKGIGTYNGATVMGSDLANYKAILDLNSSITASDDAADTMDEMSMQSWNKGFFALAPMESLMDTRDAYEAPEVEPLILDF